MSAILAVCGDSFCAMVSDGRFVEEPITGDTPHVIKNDLPKVRKINRNVVVGFAGDTLAAVQIINAVDEYQTQYLTLEKVVKILREKPPPCRCSRWRPAHRGWAQPQGRVRYDDAGQRRWLRAADSGRPPGRLPHRGRLLPHRCGLWLEEEVKPQAADWRSLTMWPARWMAALQDGQERQEHQYHIFPSACPLIYNDKGRKNYENRFDQ